MNETKIWTTGRRGCITCITATVYEDATALFGENNLVPIVASAESDLITPRQMEKALMKEFPGRTFSLQEDEWTLRAEATR